MTCVFVQQVCPINDTLFQGSSIKLCSWSTVQFTVNCKWSRYWWVLIVNSGKRFIQKHLSNVYISSFQRTSLMMCDCGFFCVLIIIQAAFRSKHLYLMALDPTQLSQNHEALWEWIIRILFFSFYTVNEVQKFQYSRPVRKGEKDPDNEFAVSFLLFSMTKAFLLLLFHSALV